MGTGENERVVQLVYEGWGGVDGLVGSGMESGCGFRGSKDFRKVGLGEGCGRLRVGDLGEYRSGRQARSKSYTCTPLSRHFS